MTSCPPRRRALAKPIVRIPSELKLGDVIRSPDSVRQPFQRAQAEHRLKREPKHKRVVVDLTGGSVVWLAICTNRDGEPKPCPIIPGDVQDGIVEHDSFVDFYECAERDAAEVMRMLRAGSMTHHGNCGPEILRRIMTLIPILDEVAPWLRRRFAGATPPRRIFRI